MFTGVCLSTGGDACSGGVHGPRGKVHGPGGCMVWGGCLAETTPLRRLLLRAVRILLECILVRYLCLLQNSLCFERENTDSSWEWFVECKYCVIN